MDKRNVTSDVSREERLAAVAQRIRDQYLSPWQQGAHNNLGCTCCGYSWDTPAEERHAVDCIVKAAGEALSLPATGTEPKVPGFMRKRIEQAIEEGLHPKGMSPHNGKGAFYCHDIQRLLAIIDATPAQNRSA